MSKKKSKKNLSKKFVKKFVKKIRQKFVQKIHTIGTKNISETKDFFWPPKT